MVLIMPAPLLAQEDYSSQAAMQVALKLAKKYMIAYQGDKAFPITLSLIEQLKATNQYDTPFGFQVRLIHGLSLVRSTAEVPSFEFLWQLRDESKKHEEWAVYAQSCRGIAFVLELSNRPKEAFQNLRQAISIIRKYNIDSVYAPVAIRHSSVHRLHGSMDSARYFAQVALRLAPQFGQSLEEASGNFLMSIYTENEAEKIAYLKKAAKLYWKVGEMKTFISMHTNLAKFYLKIKEPQKALVHTDTAIYFHQYIPEEESRDKHRSLEYKAEAFLQLGILDSANLYLKKAHATELQEMENMQKVRMAEVDRKYNLERKAEELEAEQEKNVLLVGLVIVFILLSGGLVYNFLNLRKANKLIQQQADRLKAIDQAKTRFFANISHELRTPLALMLGPVQLLLKEHIRNTRQQELLEMARRGGKQLERLINEILDLRKLESNKMSIQRSATDLRTFYRLHAGQFSSLAESKQIEFVQDIQLMEGLVGALDQEKCKQILYNLLSNAFKYTPEGGKIGLSVHLDVEKLHITVKDTGPGIHPDDLSQLFDPYFQTNRREKPIEGGTGIGLALCKEHLQLLGGQIQVKSELGKGAQFSAWHPIKILPKNTTASVLNGHFSKPELSTSHSSVDLQKRDTPQIFSSTPSPHLLIVEDNPDLRTYIELILEDRYKLTMAENGKQALEALSGPHKFQLILSDIMMPVMDGFQLLETLKSNKYTRHIPVLMLTARAATADKLNALRIGVDDYMAKPFENEELLVRIENLLNNYAIRVAFSQEEQKDRHAFPLIAEADREWLEKFESFVQENLSLDILSIPMLADEFAMSESTLLRQLKRLTGLTPQQYIIEVRMEGARRFIEERKFSSTKIIAAAVGYKDARAFSRAFKKRFGKSPSELFAV